MLPKNINNGSCQCSSCDFVFGVVLRFHLSENIFHFLFTIGVVETKEVFFSLRIHY